MFGFTEKLGQAGEVRAMRTKDIRTKSILAEALLRLAQFDGIDIQTVEMSSGPQERHDLARVPPVTESAIDRNVSGFRREHLQNFCHHDGSMRSGRCLARGQHLLDCVGVMSRVMLLVFLFEPPRVLSGIPRTPPMSCWFFPSRGTFRHTAKLPNS